MPMRADYHQLRVAALIFAIGVGLHGFDHLMRGTDPLPVVVLIAGYTQYVLIIVTVAMVYRGRPFAPVAAIAIGLLSIVGFSAAHLLPTWGSGWFSDSFVTPAVNSGVTWFSWVTVLAEIGTALVFVVAGAHTLRAGRVSVSAGQERANGRSWAFATSWTMSTPASVARWLRGRQRHRLDPRTDPVDRRLDAVPGTRVRKRLAR